MYLWITTRTHRRTHNTHAHTHTHTHAPRLCLKEHASHVGDAWYVPLSMVHWLIVVTFDTSHIFEMSPLKELASLNILCMSVTLDTSHFPIGPCRLLGQSPFGDNFRHKKMARLSGALDGRANCPRRTCEHLNFACLRFYPRSSAKLLFERCRLPKHVVHIGHFRHR